jgi:hypothetical protein
VAYTTCDANLRTVAVRSRVNVISDKVYYIHYNPVKHGVVPRVVAWPFSSFHRFVRLGWLNPDWGGGEETENGADFGE